jgi:retinoblastoma-like protein 1
MFPVDKDEIRSPKRACTERRNVLVDSNSFRSPVKDILKSKLPPPLQSAFARLTFFPDFSMNASQLDG